MMKSNLGLIGLGRIGKAHLQNSLRLRNAKVVAVSDISKKSLATARSAGVKNLFADYKKLLKDPEIHAVIISLPTFLHRECAIEVAESGKHIFIEKPLARNLKEGEEIVSSAKQNGIKLMVGYPMRFSSSFIELKNSLELGFLGDVQVATATFISTGPFFHRTQRSMPKPVPNWWFDKESTGGGALLDVGCHLINLLRWYFGDVEDIRSHPIYRYNMDFEDHAICILRFKNGPVATLNVGWSGEYYEIGVHLHGTAKSASAISQSPGMLETVKKMLKRERSEFYRELQHFVDCLISDSPPCVSGEEALEDLKLISKAYKNRF